MGAYASVRTGLPKPANQQVQNAAGQPQTQVAGIEQAEDGQVAEEIGIRAQLRAGITQIDVDLKRFLNENQSQRWIDFFEAFEYKSGLTRGQGVYGIGWLVAFYLLAGTNAATVCNVFIGVLYPAFISLRAARSQSPDTSQDASLLTYWSIFGSLWLLDSILAEAPMYFLLKAIGLLILVLPQTNGAEIFLTNIVEPIFAQAERLLNKDE